MRGFATGDLIADGTRNGFALAFADYIENVALAANTLVRVPIPTDATRAVFSFDGDFRAKLGVVGTDIASLPVAVTTADGTGSELNPAARTIPRFLGDGTTTPTHICLRATDACTGSIAFYKI